MTPEARPEWLRILDAECIRLGSQAAVAEILRHGTAGFPSPATLSQVRSGKYKGDLKRIQAIVEGALMAKTVDCPVLGILGRDRCMQEQTRPFAATNPMRVQLFHACKTCPNRRQQS